MGKELRSGSSADRHQHDGDIVPVYIWLTNWITKQQEEYYDDRDEGMAPRGKLNAHPATEGHATDGIAIVDFRQSLGRRIINITDDASESMRAYILENHPRETMGA